MSRVTKRHSLTQFLLASLLGLLLTACAGSTGSTQVTPQAAPPAFSDLTQDANWYLAQVAQSGPADRFAWQVLASRSLIQAGDLQQAQAILQQLDKEAFTPRLRSQYKLLQATLLQRQADAASALVALADLDLRPLDATTLAYHHKLKAQLLLDNGDKLAAVQSLSALDALLPADQQDANRQQIWQLLQGYNADTLRAYEEKPAPDTASGWFELAALVSELGAQPDALTQALQAWQQAYPNHPGLALWQSQAHDKQPLDIKDQGQGSYAPSQIAVFLPLSGNLANHGNTLRNGIMVGYKEAGLQADLRFYDSAAQPMDKLYQQAVADGAQFIIGPLLKSELTALLALDPQLPVLALNEPDQVDYHADRFFFSLSPEGDAKEVARRIQAEGHVSPLLVLPAGTLGQRTFDAFNQEWQQLTGGQAKVAWMSSREQMQDSLGEALGVSSRNGKAVAGNAEGDVKQADTDAIFMLASPIEATTIRSYVEYVLDPRAPRPAYYLGPKSNVQDRVDLARELNGVELGDMPWMLGQYGSLREQVASLLPPDGGELLRFYALGVDAIKLLPHLADLNRDHSSQLAGLCGGLSLNDKGVVERHLSWGKYDNGELVGEAGAPAEPATGSDPAAQPDAEQQADADELELLSQ
ncbi:penicillin-binding protein activator [Pseudaeromonas paramecii]|uniref:Penicillin-binding protein activator n=1 Tax=Pseudaeromonas paramecii TaxID=2138166 RepID=A0ABP8QB10_9GAMM